MKVSGFFSIFPNNNKSTNFSGTPYRLPPMSVSNYQDALNIWNRLKSAKYLDAHCNSYYDKLIRADNYSFLDRLTSYNDKSGFVEKYCEFTRFPNLRDVSNKIDDTFKSCIRGISLYLNSKFGTSDFDIIDSGYDPTCSLGLRKAFPGSDLDKGYIILKGSDFAYKDENIVNDFKGELWEKLDQRIVSLNHPDTYPSVYTKNQIKTILEFLDEKTNCIGNNTKIKAGIGTFTALSIGALFGPIGIIGGAAIAGLLLGASSKNDENNTNPYEAGKFNIKIAEKINNPKDREQAKNFAFFIEIVMANLKKNPKYDSIFDRIKNSPFVENSNVTQVEAWQKKIAGGYMKTKLRRRENLESDFYKMTTDTKYDLVKDIIKYGTDDQSNKFSQYFLNDDDIAYRYKKLLDSLK